MTTVRDELMAQIERCLDGDLTREERLELFARLAAMPDGPSLLAEAVKMERKLTELGQAYAQIEPSTAFSRKLLAALTARPATSNVLGAWLLGALRRNLWPTLAGAAVATLAFIYIVTPARDIKMAERWAEQAVARVQTMDIPFQTASDNAAWTHGVRLEAGQSVRLEVQANSDDNYHLRVVGEGETDVTLVHSRHNARDQVHRLQRQVHYAALPKPRAGDVLTVVNNGRTAVSIHIATGGGEELLVHPVARSGATLAH